MATGKLPKVLLFGAGGVGTVYLWLLSRNTSTTAVCRSNYEIAKNNGFIINSSIFGQGIHFRPNVVKSCEEAVSKIQDSVGKVERLLLVPKTRTLGKTYMGFKEPEIRKLLEEMEHAKSSVLLAFSIYQQYASSPMFECYC